MQGAQSEGGLVEGALGSGDEGQESQAQALPLCRDLENELMTLERRISASLQIRKKFLPSYGGEINNFLDMIMKMECAKMV